MGKFKSILILVLAIVCICGIVLAVDAPTSFDGSMNLIPISDSSDNLNVSDCTNGSCLVDSNGRYAVSNSSNSSSDDNDKTNHDDEINYDSKYYDGSLINGIYFCNDLEKAFKDAQEYDRNVMIIFDGAACIYCEYLKDEGLTDADVQKEINENDILLITDTSESPELSGQLGIHGTPTTVIFDKDGNELGRIVGYENQHQYLSELKDCNGK